MANIKVRFFLTLLVLAAFFGPFMAVIAVENARRENKVLSDKEIAAAAKKEADDARYQYYLGIAEQRDVLRKSMANSKSQYEQLLKDQPQLIKDNQKTVTQTTTEPVKVQKVVSVPVKSTTTKAKSSTTTKAS